MIPSNISSFPLVKIDPAALPHIPPLVTHSTTSANPVALPPNGLSVNQRPGMANNHMYAWVFVPIIPNGQGPFYPSHPNAR